MMPYWLIDSFIYQSGGYPEKQYLSIWWHRTGSTLAQMMACCLMVPNHYLNKCLLIIIKVRWHSSGGISTRDTPATNHWNYLEKYSAYLDFHSNFPGAIKLGDAAVTKKSNFHTHLTDWYQKYFLWNQLFVNTTKQFDNSLCHFAAMNHAGRMIQWMDKYHHIKKDMYIYTHTMHNNALQIYWLKAENRNWLRNQYFTSFPGLYRGCILGTFSTLKSGMSPNYFGCRGPCPHKFEIHKWQYNISDPRKVTNVPTFFNGITHLSPFLQSLGRTLLFN